MAEEKRRWPNQKFKKRRRKTDCYHHDIHRWKKESFPNEANLEGELCENFKKDVVD